MSAEGRSAQAIVHDVRQELAELSDNYRERDPALAAKLVELAERLARLQGLTAAPTTSSYRHQIHMFQRWLRERGHADEPPIEPATVLAYLKERSPTIASVTLRKDAMGIRRWHQAEGLPDPTDDDETVALFTALGEAWSRTSLHAEHVEPSEAAPAPDDAGSAPDPSA